MGLTERVKEIRQKTDPRFIFERTYGHTLVALGSAYNQRGMVGPTIDLHLNGNVELVSVDTVRRDFLAAVWEEVQKLPGSQQLGWLETFFTDLDDAFPPGKRVVVEKK